MSIPYQFWEKNPFGDRHAKNDGSNAKCDVLNAKHDQEKTPRCKMRRDVCD